MPGQHAVLHWLTIHYITTITVATIIMIMVATAGYHYRHITGPLLITGPTIIIVMGTTIDGAIRFARHGLHSTKIEIIFPAVVFESLAIALWRRGHHHAKIYQHGPGIWGHRLYIVALIAGGIVAAAADNIPAACFRAIMPTLAVWLINLELSPDTPSQAATWIIWIRHIARRITIQIGWTRPDDSDIDQIHHGYQIRRMAAIRNRILVGGWLPTRWYRTRYRRMALRATDEVLHEVQAAVTRAVHAEAITAPTPYPDEYRNPHRIRIQDTESVSVPDCIQPRSTTVSTIRTPNTDGVLASVPVPVLSGPHNNNEVMRNLTDEEIINDMKQVGIRMSIRQIRNRYAIGQPRATNLRSRI